MSDAKRFKPVSGDSSHGYDDPRQALARQYLQKAAAELAEKEAEKPRRARSTNSSGNARPFTLSIAPATFVHVVLASMAITFSALAVLWCYNLLHINLTVARVIALPVGTIVAATFGYVSVLFLGFVESTSTGHTDVTNLQGDWRDWFWTLPSTLGILALAAFVGWLLSLAIPANVWVLIGLCVLLLYPILQLSSLETGSPFVPLSLPVALSFARHPIAWFMFYAIAFAAANLLWFVGHLAWHDPPYPTVLVMGPLISVAIFAYAWLLGQLAFLISSTK